MTLLLQLTSSHVAMGERQKCFERQDTFGIEIFHDNQDYK